MSSVNWSQNVFCVSDYCQRLWHMYSSIRSESRRPDVKWHLYILPGDFLCGPKLMKRKILCGKYISYIFHVFSEERDHILILNILFFNKLRQIIPEIRSGHKCVLHFWLLPKIVTHVFKYLVRVPSTGCKMTLVYSAWRLPVWT
jgi:hypothetical protein